MLGIVVDAVSEVLNIRGTEIEDTPTFGVKLNTGYILGLAKTGRALKILLDIDRVFRSEENMLPEKNSFGGEEAASAG